MTWYTNSQGRYGANGAKGDHGEALVKEYCESNGIPFTKLNDRHSQCILKIDCIIDDKKVDVKANVKDKSLIVELYTLRGPGWLYDTSADYIYGVDIEKKHIYRYLLEDMKKYASANRRKSFRTKTGDVLMRVPLTESIIERIL